jgi:hypothetical protein
MAAMAILPSGSFARKDPMPQTLPFISAARRLRSGRARRQPAPDATRAVTAIDAARAQTLADFEREVHAVREAIFHLADAAHRCVSSDHTQLHVSLQVVSNELGQIERMLDLARAAAPDAAVTAS